jgi:hypothetical protein
MDVSSEPDVMGRKESNTCNWTTLHFRYDRGALDRLSNLSFTLNPCQNLGCLLNSLTWPAKGACHSSEEDFCHSETVC